MNSYTVHFITRATNSYVNFLEEESNISQKMDKKIITLPDIIQKQFIVETQEYDNSEQHPMSKQSHGFHRDDSYFVMFHVRHDSLSK